jgi:hypothetical protein
MHYQRVARGGRGIALLLPGWPFSPSRDIGGYIAVPVAADSKKAISRRQILARLVKKNLTFVTSGGIIQFKSGALISVNELRK